MDFFVAVLLVISIPLAMPVNETVQVAVYPPSRVVTVITMVSSPNDFLQDTVAVVLPSESGVTVS